MALRPPIPNEALYAAPRFAVITSIGSDIDVMATYGSLTRRITCLNASGGDLVVDQSSPYDDASGITQTIPVPQAMPLDISASKIRSSTTCLPLLLQF